MICGRLYPLSSLHTVVMGLSHTCSWDKLDIWLLGGPDQGLAASRPDSDTRRHRDLKSQRKRSYKGTEKQTDPWVCKAAGIIHKGWNWANQGQCLPAALPTLVWWCACVCAWSCPVFFQINSWNHNCFLLTVQHLHLPFAFSPPDERKYNLYLQYNTREATNLLEAIWISLFSPGSSTHPNAVTLVSIAGWIDSHSVALKSNWRCLYFRKSIRFSAWSYSLLR